MQPVSWIDVVRGRRGGYEEWTTDELYDRAREVGIDGRSDMDKDELIAALRDLS